MTDWRDIYRQVELTEEEREEAILEGQKKKWFHERAIKRDQDNGMQELRESKSRKSGPDVVRLVQQTSESSGQSEGSAGTKANKKGKSGKVEGAATVREAAPKVPER